MNLLKKYAPLILAFLLGAVITCLTMSLMQARKEIVELREQVIQSKEPLEKAPAVDKHWMDVMIEERVVETELRIKDQQAEGDDLRNQFEQFSE